MHALTVRHGRCPTAGARLPHPPFQDCPIEGQGELLRLSGWGTVRLGKQEAEKGVWGNVLNLVRVPLNALPLLHSHVSARHCTLAAAVVVEDLSLLVRHCNNS